MENPLGGQNRAVVDGAIPPPYNPSQGMDFNQYPPHHGGAYMPTMPPQPPVYVPGQVVMPVYQMIQPQAPADQPVIGAPYDHMQ